jgi:hypothetical protein
VVLDDEAVQALADPRHRKHRAVLAVVAAANGRARRRARPVAELATSPVVRVEAGVARDTPAAAGLNRLRIVDVPLDGARADRAVSIRRAVPLASVVDAAVAELAVDRAGTGATTTILTSDRADLTALLLHAGTRAEVRVHVV